MTQLMDHIEYLSKEIGPRPAGTEEEQQASLYITEQIQKETGFTANIEEFENSSGYDIALAALAAVSVVVTVLAILFPVVAIPALILGAIAAAVYALEAFDRPVLSRFFARGASQNVVAKYQPNHDTEQRGRARSRKIILVAHYDTGRVTPSIVKTVESLPVPVSLICVIAMIAAAFFLLVRLFIAPGGGMGLLVLNVLSIIAALICLLPVVKAILLRTAPYNEGAVNNASGTAALIEIARRIATGSVSEAELAQSDEFTSGVVIHGEEAARAEGLVPEGVEIVYEAGEIAPMTQAPAYDDEEEMSEEERLLAAKAAIAALTGKPVENMVYGDVADKQDAAADGAGEGLADMDAEGADLSNYSTGEIEALNATGIAEGDTSVDGFSNVPSWFAAAQQNARKPEGGTGAVNVQRSVYTDAFDRAEREVAAREEERRLAEEAAREAARKAREEEIRLSLERAEEERRMQQEALKNQDAFAQADGGEGDEQGLEQGFQPIPAFDAQPSWEEQGAEWVDPAATAGSEPVLTEAAEGDAFTVPEIPAVLDDGDQGQETDESQGRQGLIADLPSIQPGAGVQETTSPSRSGLIRTLRTNVPSLSGILNPVSAEEEKKAPAVNVPNINLGEEAQTDDEWPATPDASEIPGIVSNIPMIVTVPEVPTTEAPAPQDEAPQGALGPTDSLDNATIAMDPIDYALEFPIDDIDDIDVPAPPVQPAQVESHEAAQVAVPRSRSGSLLDKLRRNRGEDLSDTPQQWLDVDENFEARSVGRARGSWESFRDDQYFDDEEGFDEFGSGDERKSGRRWQGGAYSRESLGRVNMLSGAESKADEPVPEEPELTQDERELTGEIEQIYHFRNPQFNMEIWFVAIGSDGAGHDGAKAFLDEHHDELRGSMFIEVESLGAGTLSSASEEGRVSKVSASSRIKRFAREATAATGIALDTVSLAGSDSISSTVQKAGFQAMHVFGAENGRPALKGSADDVMENIDELLLDEHINYVFELLKR